MTYFPDGSDYADDRGHNSGAVNIGWLAKDRDYACGETPSGLVKALLACATRPVHLHRGMHECELCDDAPFGYPMDLDGRELTLGNGEIRLHGADGIEYAAPTLVAHYVDAHGYAPPAPFIAAALARGASLHVVRGEALRCFEALDWSAQRDRLIDLWQRAAAAVGTELGTLVPKLHASATTEASRDQWRDWWLHEEPRAELLALDDETRHLTRLLVASLSRIRGAEPDARQRTSAPYLYTRFIERLADAGHDVSAR